MTILYLSAYAYPEYAASSYLTENRNQAFIAEGFKIIIYTPVPTRGIDKETRNIYSGKLKHETLYDGGLIIHRFSLMREGKNPVLRAFRYVLSCIIQFWKGVFAKDARKCNLLFVGSTPPIQGMMAAMVKKCRKIPIVYVVQDVFPDSLIGSGLAKKDGLLWKMGNRIANITYRNADKIIVISEDFKKNLLAKGVPEEKIVVVYNWVDSQSITPVMPEDNTLFSEFDISKEKFRVVYAGNLGNAQNISIIIDAASRLKERENIAFVLFGTGGLENEIRDRIEKEQLENVRLLPLQPYERVSEVYSLGDVDIVSCKAGLGGSAMPSKTWSIMSTGRPVLANFDEGELKMILEKNDCGVFTKAGDVGAFVEAIEKLAANRERCQEMGRNGRQFILKNLTKEVGTKKYVDVIKSVIKK